MKKLSDTPRNVYDRETYAWRKAHHICIKCGHVEAFKNHVYCIDCLEQKRETERANRKPRSTEEKYAQALHRRRRYDLLIAFGICTSCGNHKAMAGHTLCLECNLRQKNRMKKQSIKKGIYPRDSYSGLCILCNKKAPINGKKLCSECYEKALLNLAKANASNDNQKHIWRTMNSIAFNRNESTAIEI